MSENPLPNSFIEDKASLMRGINEKINEFQNKWEVVVTEMPVEQIPGYGSTEMEFDCVNIVFRYKYETTSPK